MNDRIRTVTMVTAVVLALCSVTHAQEPPRLSHNPFARPSSKVTIPVRPRTRDDGSTQEIDLRATLVGSKVKLADVAGKVLRPGDEVQGYTLLQVFEDRAVFAKAGSRLTIYVKTDPEENDE